MTVNYSLDAATASAWAVIVVIFKWKGSLWKLIWRETLGWTILMAVLYSVYVYGLKGTEHEQYYKTLFDLTKDVPMDGTLMFLISYMIFNCLTRWLETFRCLGWPENVALMFKQHFNKEAFTRHEQKLINQTVARYLTVFYILLFRDVSSDVRDMFPTFDDMADSGILTPDEVHVLKSSRLDRHSPHYWIPIDWIVTLIRTRYEPTHFINNKHGQRVRNRKMGIMTEMEYLKFINELNKLRGKLGDVLSYDWVPLPLALFQSLTIFCYGVLIVNCFQMQARIITSNTSGLSEMFVECMSTLPLSMIHLAYLRISQVIVNPFGSDDDDFETQYLIDRHIQVLNEILCPEETKKRR